MLISFEDSIQTKVPVAWGGYISVLDETHGYPLGLP
jgi:hypothetical protein